ncbi:MAG TPA: hypothetical protein VGJ87_23425 [Roseiflexaceae bacterium]
MKLHSPGPWGALVEQVSENDRRFFERNRGVNIRIRAYHPGEFGPAERAYGVPSDTTVIVTQIRPGIRHRRLVREGGVR